MKYMNMKRLFLDLDGTVARFHDEVSFLERMFEKGFFRSLKPFENMVNAIKRLSTRPDLEIIGLSAVVNENPFCVLEKNLWCDEFLPEIDVAHRIFTSIGKPKVEYIQGGITQHDFLLDDYNKNLREFLAANGSAIKCVNNINHKGLGAYGGNVGSLWDGVKINNLDDSEKIVDDLIMILGLERQMPLEQLIGDAEKQKEVSWVRNIKNPAER